MGSSLLFSFNLKLRTSLVCAYANYYPAMNYGTPAITKVVWVLKWPFRFSVIDVWDKEIRIWKSESTIWKLVITIWAWKIVTRINNLEFQKSMFEERSLPHENGKPSVGIKGAVGWTRREIVICWKYVSLLQNRRNWLIRGGRSRNWKWALHQNKHFGSHYLNAELHHATLLLRGRMRKSKGSYFP